MVKVYDIRLGIRTEHHKVFRFAAVNCILNACKDKQGKVRVKYEYGSLFMSNNVYLNMFILQPRAKASVKMGADVPVPAFVYAQKDIRVIDAKHVGISLGNTPH